MAVFPPPPAPHTAIFGGTGSKRTGFSPSTNPTLQLPRSAVVMVENCRKTVCFYVKTHGARSDISGHHFLRTWYAFSSSQCVLAAGCVI
ncbi:unnamed protein product [Prunus armeniaca]